MSQKTTATQKTAVEKTATQKTAKSRPEQQTQTADFIFSVEYAHSMQKITEEEISRLKFFGVTDAQIEAKRNELQTDTFTVYADNLINVETLSDVHQSFRRFLTVIANDDDEKTAVRFTVKFNDGYKTLTLTDRKRNGETKVRVIFTLTAEDGENYTLDSTRPFVIEKKKRNSIK